ncbi:MAG: bifunctional oligoribonuclease/PAP phosphatase NrnA [Bacteroidales bacterium]|nr:bifunctional oligoribonuclease/PAP phosphatase NrnA [Bacteroidales bacterium]
MFDNIQVQKVGKLLSQPKNIALVSHKNPDGDTISASLAMMHYLRQKGHSISILVPNQYPEFYNWIPGCQEFIIFDKDAALVREKVENADIIFCIDFNRLSRTGNMATDLSKSKAVKIVIDHHLEPSEEFDYYFTETDTSSTGELVYEFIEAFGDKKMINKDIAIAIYVAIMTDTGSFSYSCDHARTYQIASELIGNGVEVSLVHKLVYDTFTETRLRLLGFAISERMLVWKEFHAAVIYLDKKDLDRFNYQVGDTEGVVNYPLSIADVNLSVLLTEKDRLIRISFRSKGNFNVNRLASAHFDGGGHKNASGGTSALTIDETIGKLKEVIQHYKEELDYKISL